jgi:hypothetical protein
MEYSFRLTKEQYNYLLPVCKSQLLYISNGIHFKNGDIEDLFAFIGTKEGFEDIKNRCKYLDEDLKDNADYLKRLNYNNHYNSGLRYKQIHH